MWAQLKKRATESNLLAPTNLILSTTVGQENLSCLSALMEAEQTQSSGASCVGLRNLVCNRRAALQLRQLRVLRFSLFEDGDFGIGVFPKGQEILIS
jgi:hypothetical protein